MSYELFILIILIVFIMLLFTLNLIMPFIMHREIFFGVQISENLMNDAKLKKFKRAYIKNYIFICGIYTLIYSVTLLLMPDNIVLITGLIIFFILSTLLYYSTHKKVLQYKNSNSVSITKKQIVVVDTSFRNDKTKKILPSALWFSLPGLIILFNVIAGYSVFDNLPIFVATHWNTEGMVDGSVIKSYGIIFMFPLIQTFITMFMFVLYKAIGRSKQQFNVNSPEDSKERSRIFRYRWAADIIFLNIIILLIVTIINLFILQIVSVNIMLLSILEPILINIIFVDILFMAIWTGQGGSRINITSNDYSNVKCEMVNNDNYWKWGLFYFNPSDPALFIEKRFGIGWGLNYGRVKAYVLIGLVIGSIFSQDFIIKALLIS